MSRIQRGHRASTACGSGRTETSPATRSEPIALAVSILLLALLSAGTPMGAPVTPSELFVLRPDPPKEGQDVEVVYIGNSPKTVAYRVGEGDSHTPTIGRNGKFTIPKGLLDAGQDLVLEDLSIGQHGVAVRRIVR